MLIWLPGFSPTTFHGDLTRYDHIVLSVSGGKDSHAMLFYVLEMAEKQGVKNRMKAVYADTGMEWHNAEKHVKKICKIANVPLKIVRPKIGLIERMEIKVKNCPTVKFPSPRCRYCTAKQKCDPIDSYIRSFQGKILQITGERRDESRSRSKLPDYGINNRLCLKNGKRIVEGWRPMLEFETEDVFSVISGSGAPPHQCYEMGSSRLGCAGCIFSSDNDLTIEMRENPEIYHRLDKLEIDSGYTMSMTKKRIRDRVKL